MEMETGKLCAEGLSFFGKTNRLISHELKNILAIISETLGLMDELMKLSETGKTLEPGKLRSLSESIIEEIERANTIIRNMNTFAHFVDEHITDVDICRTVALIVQITQLDSPLRGTKVVIPDSDTCVVHTSHLFLANLIYHVLCFALRGAGPENEIRIASDSNDEGVRITFSGIASNIIGEFPTRKESLLAEMLSAEVSLETAVGELHIELPKRLGEGHLEGFISNG
jgi:signal transduction histidine kinase